jgi:hypothetical protein
MFLERVWWPIFGNLNDLHPEYEVRIGGGDLILSTSLQPRNIHLFPAN